MTTMTYSHNQRRTHPLTLAVPVLAALLAFGLIWPQHIAMAQAARGGSTAG